MSCHSAGIEKNLCFHYGLDDFDGPGSDLLDAIYSLEDRSGIKICMASRPYPVWKEDLSNHQHLVMQDHNYHSIQLYTEAQFSSNRIVGIASLPRQLVDKIREKAREVFLWARLATDDLLRDFLAGKSMTELELHLEKMPQEVQEMYQRVLDKLPEVHKVEAALLLYILTASGGSVEVRKLFTAMKTVASKFSTSYVILPVDEDDDNDCRLLALLGDFVDISIREHYDRPFIIFGRAGIHMQYEAASTSVVRLTHETSHAYSRNNTWLEDILKPNLILSKRPRFWFNLYLDELLDCGERYEALSSATLVRYHDFLTELLDRFDGSSSSDGEAQIQSSENLEVARPNLNEVQDEVIGLLKLWSHWTPLLAYALQEMWRDTSELFAVGHPPDERINDLQRVLCSSICWLHKLICVFQGIHYAATSMGRYLPGLFCFRRADDQARSLTLLSPHISVALCHGMPSCLVRSFRDENSISSAAKRLVFDYGWDKYTSHAETRWRDLLLMLARTGHFRGKHLWEFLTSVFRNTKWSSVLKLLKSCQGVRVILSEHTTHREFHRSLTPEVGFLCHWAEATDFERAISEEDLTTSFEALSVDKECLSQIAALIGEPPLNIVLQPTKYASFPYRSILLHRFLLALQAGADSHIVGKSGTAFDVARAQLEDIRVNDSSLSHGESPEFLQMQKIVELLEYYAAHDGKLPQDLSEFLKYNV